MLVDLANTWAPLAASSAEAPLFNLDTSAVQTVGQGKKLTVSNVKLTLSQAAADALNQLFGVNVFTVNFPIGTATVKINNSRFE